MSKPLRRLNPGFTLIELMIVILLLVVVAATAIPKFMPLNKEAQLAATRAIAGGLNDAVQIAHNTWVKQREIPTLRLSDGTQIQTGMTGWPEIAVCPNCVLPSHNIGTVTQFKCQAMIANILQNPPPIKGTAENKSCPAPDAITCPTVCSRGVNCLTAEGSGSVCTFTDANANVIHYNIQNGVVTVESSLAAIVPLK